MYRMKSFTQFSNCGYVLSGMDPNRAEKQRNTRKMKMSLFCNGGERSIVTTFFSRKTANAVAAPNSMGI